MTIFEIRPHRGGWQCFETEGVAPYFTEGDAKRLAISYARGRTSGRVGEIRVFNAAGARFCSTCPRSRAALRRFRVEAVATANTGVTRS